MKKIIKINFFLFFVLFSNFLIAQSEYQKRIPRIMIIPTDEWYEKNGFGEWKNNVFEPNYELAFIKSSDLNTFIKDFSNRITENGLEVTSLEEQLKILNTNKTNRSVNKSTYSDKSIGNSAIDMIIENARPDIIIEVFWTKKNSGESAGHEYGQLSYTFLDAYTGVFLTSGYFDSEIEPIGKYDMTRTLSNILEASMGDIVGKLKGNYEKMTMQGRKIYVEFVITEDQKTENNKNLTFNSEFGDDEDPLKDIIKAWMKSNSVAGVHNISQNTPFLIKFNPQISLQFEDADSYIKPIRKELKKFGLHCETMAGSGPGFVRVIVERKID
jgi:hypothetical protein